MSRLKVYEYRPTYRVEAINFDKAQAKADDIDHRAAKGGAVKRGEARLTCVDGDDERKAA